MKTHLYTATVTWTGNTGTGTSQYNAYDRSHIISIPGKDPIAGSSDPSFRGDRTKYNPEELLVSALSCCHMLWYLHLCATHQVVVIKYTDEAQGVMEENQDGSGQFSAVTLQPKVAVAEQRMVEKALHLHEEANKMCFIARSMKFPVLHKPQVITIEKH